MNTKFIGKLVGCVFGIGFIYTRNGGFGSKAVKITESDSNKYYMIEFDGKTYKSTYYPSIVHGIFWDQLIFYRKDLSQTYTQYRSYKVPNFYIPSIKPIYEEI